MNNINKGYTRMKNSFAIITVFLPLLIMLPSPAIAVSYKPSETAESEFHPVANVCGPGHNRRDGSYFTRYAAGYKLTGLGDQMTCSIPFKANRYIERIVMDVSLYGVEPRVCHISYTRASGGSIGSDNSRVEMNFVRDGNAVYVWQYDDFGILPAYLYNSHPHIALLLQCQHHNMTGNQFVRYGSIRVDYSPTEN
jgi:hypothetical protein